jgi:YVTN family beta-propeller protein
MMQRCSQLILMAAVAAGTAYPQASIATLPSGQGPYAAAVNPVTNRIYIANYTGNSVTVIDGSNHTTATVSAGIAPASVAVNPATNKIYVANFIGATLTVIDGATNGASTIGVGTGASTVAVNPVTNKIYVANSVSGTVTVIDGATHSTSTIGGLFSPWSVAVNPVTNKIYVTGDGPGNLTVIDGATNAVTTVTGVGRSRFAAVNPATGKVYAAVSAPNGVTVVDGATLGKIFIPMASAPNSIAVNSLTDKIYAAGGASSIAAIDGATNVVTALTTPNGASNVAVNAAANKVYVSGSNGFTAIDGASYAMTAVPTGSSIQGAAVNPVTNRIYGFSTNGNAVAVIDGASNDVATIAAGAVSYPEAIAMNPVTNKIYAANPYADTVTVIDGATGGVNATVPVGRFPRALAVNPATNKIYVAHSGDGSVAGGGVTEIDGATNAAKLIPGTGGGPVAVAVNPVTNRIYVANTFSNEAMTIDGATGAVKKAAAGSAPNGVAVNPVTNRIYVTNLYSDNVTVLDGLTNATLTVPAGLAPLAVAVNPVTNRIYVANGGRSQGGSVTVIDGATNAAVNLAVSSNPYSLAVNPVTNRIYVGKYSTGDVTVIDGATNAAATVMAQTGGFSIAVNPVTNKVYVPNYYGAGSVTVIDGLTNQTSLVGVGTGPSTVTVNPVTGRIYVGNATNVTEIAERRTPANPPVTMILPEPSGPGVRKTFTFAPANGAGGAAANAVYFQLDSWGNAWTQASRSGSAFSATLNGLLPGFHILYAYATDGQEATSTQPSSPVVGGIQAYGFLVTPVFGGVDAVTQGGWNGQYGGDGYFIANGASGSPPYASYNVAGAIPYTWGGQTSDPRAPQNGPAAGSNRIASAFTQYLGQPFQIHLNFAGGGPRPVALYLLDWDNAGRVQTITIRDASTNAPIDERTFSNFRDGLYALWNLQGNVILTIAPAPWTTAAVSGVFFGAAPPPSSNGSPGAPNAAAYAGLDPTTQGKWTGKFGTSGYRIANGGGSDPAYATAGVTGDFTYTWAAQTTDVRALQTSPGSPVGIASAYTQYGNGSFKIGVHVNDGQAHKVSLYLLDWDNASRSQTIEVRDANTNVLLDSRSFTGFQGGQYASWTVKGSVEFIVKGTGGTSPAVSGLFFD